MLASNVVRNVVLIYDRLYVAFSNLKISQFETFMLRSYSPGRGYKITMEEVKQYLSTIVASLCEILQTGMAAFKQLSFVGNLVYFQKNRSTSSNKCPI